MLGLPKSTEFNKRIPKQKFYENLSVTPAMKRAFIDQIRVIYWRNKVATSTMNLSAGDIVTEIEVFEVKLLAPQLEVSVLRQIDQEIPYHIVFLLEHDGKYQAWTAYKEASSGNSAFKVGTYYHSDWLSEKELLIHIDGLDLDTVYENFVRQIAGGKLSPDTTGESLKESVERDARRKVLQRQIDILQAKIRKEKQLNKQMELNSELKKLRRELEEL